MRIVHTCLRYPPAGGGVENYVERLVKETRSVDEQRDVRVVTSKMRTHGPVSYLSPKLLMNDPPYVQRLHTVTTPLLGYPRLQALRYYLHHHRPDIVHGYSYWYQPADVVSRYAKKHEKPFFFHPMYYENDIRHKIKWKIYKELYGRKTFALADVVIVISPQERQLIERAGYEVKRFELIPPGIDFYEFDKAEVERKSDTEIRLLTVSRLSASKGIDEVINVLPTILRKHKNVRLKIVGEDFGEKEKLKLLVRKLGLENVVKFTGKIAREKLVREFKQADIFIHPSFYEAFGIVIGEAMAAKCAVVARNQGAVPFVAPNEKAALLFSSRDGMIDKILKLIEDEKTRKLLVKQGYERVKENFTWEKSIKKLVDLYEEFRQ